MIRVLLAEDQAMVRGALASLLGLEEDIEVVAEVDRADAILEAARRTRPDVALLDIELPGGDGLTAAEELHRELPACRVLILTTFARPGYLRRAMAGGAAGFLLKDAPARELASAIRRALRASGSSTPASPRRRSSRARARSPAASTRCSRPRARTRRSRTSPASSTSRRGRSALPLLGDAEARRPHARRGGAAGRGEGLAVARRAPLAREAPEPPKGPRR